MYRVGSQYFFSSSHRERSGVQAQIPVPMIASVSMQPMTISPTATT